MLLNEPEISGLKIIIEQMEKRRWVVQLVDTNAFLGHTYTRYEINRDLVYSHKAAMRRARRMVKRYLQDLSYRKNNSEYPIESFFDAS